MPAQLQLTGAAYHRSTADGRVGLGQLIQPNSSGDTHHLSHPIDLVFQPESDNANSQLRAKPEIAGGRSLGSHQLKKLRKRTLLPDNQIDTLPVRLKEARFNNQMMRFLNQFVNARMLSDYRTKNAVVISRRTVNG